MPSSMQMLNKTTIDKEMKGIVAPFYYTLETADGRKKIYERVKT